MTILDGLALALFFLCWLGYGPLLALLARRSGSLNDDMLVVRRAWMMVMTHREVRIVDSQLMGHTINSAGFFASTNLLLIAAVAGILFGGDQALQGVASIGEAAPTEANPCSAWSPPNRMPATAAISSRLVEAKKPAELMVWPISWLSTIRTSRWVMAIIHARRTTSMSSLSEPLRRASRARSGP